MAPVTVLGISAFYHDSAAALLRDGEIVAAASEERFTRKKGDPSFPAHAVAYCLREGGLKVDQLDAVGFYDKPILKFERILDTYLGVAPRGFRQFLMAGPLWIKEKLWMDGNLRADLGGYAGRIYYAEHHESHAASAFYPSPFEEAAILTMDGVGEWATASYGVGRGADIQLLSEMRWPDSLGLLYSAFTYYTGFKVNSGEYKVMGLAPYGQPKYAQLIYEHLLDLADDGSFRLNQEYFGYLDDLTMTNDRFSRLFGGPPREPESKLTQREMDLARSVQDVCEEIMLRMARTVHRETGLENLCLAGGVALNCVGNGRLLREGPFKRLWIQPAAGDAGGALGVAMSLWHRYLQKPRVSCEAAGTWERRGAKYADAMHGSYLGPRATESDVKAFVDRNGYPARRFEPRALAEHVAALMADEKVIGLVQGRMEFGPRALGGRSIIGDARSPKMQSVMNLKIKFRESFRPFAPAVLREHVSEWFELDAESPYMLLVADVQPSKRLPVPPEANTLWGIEKLNVPRSGIPAVTHVDYSARIQTVHKETNPRYHALLSEFKRITGCPVVVNTSFNVRGEPIVCTPEDAFRCFMGTEIDVLAAGNCLLRKEAQDPALRRSYKDQFELD